MDSVEDNSTQIDVNNTVSSVDEGGDWDEIDDDTLLGVALSINTDVCEITDKNCENGNKKGANLAASSPTAKKKLTGCGDNHGDEGESQGDVYSRIPLLEYKRGYLWVSDLCSQTWCERQLHYKFTVPTIKVENPAMTAGSNLHLAREMEVETKVDVVVTSNEDILALKAVNLLGSMESFLAGVPVRREIPIFGAPFEDVFMIGLIDEIRCDPDTFDLDLVELKTRKSKFLPSKAQKITHKLQMMLYKKLFDDIIIGKTDTKLICHHLKLDPNKILGKDIQKFVKNAQEVGEYEDETLGGLLDSLFARGQSLPCISQLLVEYCYQEDGSTLAIEGVVYDEAWLTQQVTRHLEYWQGRRQSVGVEVEDAWKCGQCDFADICEWRQQKADECAAANRTSCNLLKRKH